MKMMWDQKKSLVMMMMKKKKKKKMMTKQGQQSRCRVKNESKTVQNNY